MEKYYEGVREITDLKDLINQSVELFGDRPAFRFKKRMYKKGEEVEFYTISYKEFKKEIDAFGTALNSLGLQNEKIALISKNRYEWNAVYYAVAIGDKTIVPLDKSLPDNEIISLAGRSEAKAIVFEEKYLDVIRKVKEEKLSDIEYYICFDFEEDSDDGILSYKKLLEKGNELLEKGDRSHLDTQIDPDKASILLFTSGTTATSKAVMLSQRNVCSNVTDLNKVMKFYSTDSTLALLPFHHTFQATINNTLFYVGASLTFCDGLKYIQQNMCEYKPTVIVSVPLILENIHKKIIKNIEKQGKTKLVNRMKKITNGLEKVNINLKRKVFKDVHEAIGGNVRLIVYGAAAMDPELIKSLDGFGLRSVQGYGLTETSPVICVENDRNRRVGSAGKPLPSQEIKIENPDENGIGEILSKGPNVMLGYYKNNEATEEVLSGGWFHTGDLGYIDKDGFLFITGRKKNVIVQKNGKNIFPEEMETLVGYIAGVKECIVYGKPTYDNDLDIAVKIVYDKDEIKNIRGFVKEDDIYAYMKEKIAEINKNMPSYKHIRDIIVTDEELIKTTTAKVKRHEEIAKILGTNKGE
jgi:long-chain acyl-CoA synthetase